MGRSSSAFRSCRNYSRTRPSCELQQETENNCERRFGRYRLADTPTARPFVTVRVRLIRTCNHCSCRKGRRGEASGSSTSQTGTSPRRSKAPRLADHHSTGRRSGRRTSCPSCNSASGSLHPGTAIEHRHRSCNCWSYRACLPGNYTVHRPSSSSFSAVVACHRFPLRAADRKRRCSPNLSGTRRPRLTRKGLVTASQLLQEHTSWLLVLFGLRR